MAAYPCVSFCVFWGFLTVRTLFRTQERDRERVFPPYGLVYDSPTCIWLWKVFPHEGSFPRNTYDLQFQVHRHVRLWYEWQFRVVSQKICYKVFEVKAYLVQSTCKLLLFLREKNKIKWSNINHNKIVMKLFWEVYHFMIIFWYR